ncbi:MAG: electron transport complex subunit RsxG [Gammaproteobacteria bacterium]|nr:electron transport complex subunit RsxG [Gammaproteobacteria bacterium]MDH4254942.1 electron transport complex subunit RsxG [Gammaproteobacteria bacterium]MDH5308841.1 electron transport complex subunit RsxG [Gammaproteobacteria bacterium]
MKDYHDPATSRPIWASGLILAVLAAVCTALVAYTNRYAAPLIAANEQKYLERSLQPVIAGIPYTGKLSESTIVIDTPHALPGREPVTVYRVFSDDGPVAALFVVTAMDGYSGPIRLLIGIDFRGHLTRVRVLQHRETPGLGDAIDSTRSDWIDQFDGASLESPPRDEWAIRRDGGQFDQLTGASITPRAVVKAIKATLVYFEVHREAVFAPPVTGTTNDNER